MSTARAPAKIPKSTAPRHSPGGATRQTTSSDPPGWDMPDTQTNTSTRDTFGGTDRARAANPRPRFPIPAASGDDETPPGPRRSRHPAHADTDTWYTPRPQTTAASLAKL